MKGYYKLTVSTNTWYIKNPQPKGRKIHFDECYYKDEPNGQPEKISSTSNHLYGYRKAYHSIKPITEEEWLTQTIL